MLCKKWTRSGALCTMALAVVASGCGGGDGSSATNAAATNSGGTPANTLSGGSAKVPKSITIAIAAQQKTLDMTQTSATESYGEVGQFTGTLAISSADGSKVTPGLAASWTSGPKSWKFKLRPNLKFSDGSPLTARDVAATLNYLKRQKNDVNGYALATIKSARALNDQEVEVATNGPSPRLDFILALPMHGIFPASKLADPAAAKKFLAAPSVTSGPYMVKSHESNKTVLVVNPNYWGPKPAVEQQTWVTVPDAAGRLEQLKGGQADFAYDLPSQTAPQLTGDVHPSYTTAAYGGQLITMNLRKGSPTSNLSLRQAISAALDRNQLSKIVYSGKVPVQTGVVPSTSEYSDPFVSASPDLAKAKALLARSNCKSPCSLKLMTFSSSPELAQLAQLIAQQLGAAGIQVSVELIDDGVFYDREGKGNFEMLVSGPFGFYAEDYVNYMLPSTGGGAGTWAGWTGADGLAKKWAVADAAGFKNLVGQALDRLHKDLPYIPLVSLGYLNGSRVPDSVFSMSPDFRYAVAAKS
jgi:ABC-type transport system substrate-binding protein